MDSSTDPDPLGRHYRAFWTEEKGQLRGKGREDDETRRVRVIELPKRALLRASLGGG